MFYNSLNKSRLIKKIVPLFCILFSSLAFAVEVPIYDFSIKSYTQNINDHFPADAQDYSTPLLKPEYQALQLQQFYTHYYSSDAQGLSPWSEQMIKSLLPVVRKIELELLEEFDNQNKPAANRHYAENFKEHDDVWLNQIKLNMDLPAIAASDFNENNRAIAVANTSARALPEEAPDFFHLSMPGQGFPFDNLQDSVIWAGTPLYIFSVSQDKAWSLALTPDGYFSWVKSADIAYASNQFISQWQAAAKKGLIAITQTDTSLVNKQKHFQFKGYIGSVFPLAQRNKSSTSILIPIKNEHHQAVIALGSVATQASALMPLVASKKNMANIIKQLQNRPYGWGGAFLFNDCSQELKSIFTPFGIWLPRNSAQQSQIATGLDLSKSTVEERINALKEKGHPLMTLIYIGSHVMLYTGNRATGGQELAPMTYQNIWGLSPASKDKRYVIGQSLFLPLLKYYPESPDIDSLANKTYFKLINLDELNAKENSPQAFSRHFSKTVGPDVNL